jgi:hypothetical protein
VAVAAVLQPRAIVGQGALRMRTLSALSLDERFGGRLHAYPFIGRVHSAFERAVNVEIDDGRLVTLACRTLDDAPDTVVIDVARFDGVVSGSTVTGDARALWLGADVRIALTSARLWSAPVLRFTDDFDGFLVRLRALDALMENGPGSFRVRHPDQSAFDAIMRAQLWQCCEALCTALTARDNAAALRAANSLVGLGPGLTPSGDDYLLGLFAVLNLAGGPCEGWLRGGRDVLDASSPHATHRISHVALVHAAHGRVRESIAALLQAVLHGAGDLGIALQRVLAIGSTSGADIVRGIVDGLQLQATNKGPLA